MRRKSAIVSLTLPFDVIEHPALGLYAANISTERGRELKAIQWPDQREQDKRRRGRSRTWLVCRPARTFYCGRFRGPGWCEICGGKHEL